MSDEQRMIAELAMLVRLLARHIPDGTADKSKALDYLKRKGLQGSVLQ
jgi:hypothetical protein